MKNRKQIWVDEQFYERLRNISQRTGRSFTSLTRELKDQDWGLSLLRLEHWKPFKGKKGFAPDILYSIVFFIVFIIIGMVAALVLSNVFGNEGFSRMINTTVTGNTTQSMVGNFQATDRTSTLDSWFVMGYFLMHIGTLVLSGVIGANAITLGLNVVVGLLVVLFASLVNNFVPNVINIFGYSGQLPMTMAILDLMPVLELFWIILLFIVLYVRGTRQ